MGIDVDLSLPPNVRVRDVAKVFGILAGCSRKLISLGNERTRFGTRVTSVAVEVEGTKIRMFPPMCETVLIQAYGAEDHHLASAHYHFESAGGRRLVSCRSTPRGIAILRGLATFFGGRVDYRDCDDAYEDFVMPDKSDEENHAEDGEAWDVLQRRIAELLPLTNAEVLRHANEAAYGSGDGDELDLEGVYV